MNVCREAKFCQRAGGTQNKRKSAMLKQSADTQECEKCHQNDKEVDMDENKEELSFITSTMSSSDGWREPNSCVTSNAKKKDSITATSYL